MERERDNGMKLTLSVTSLFIVIYSVCVCMRTGVSKIRSALNSFELTKNSHEVQLLHRLSQMS